MFKMLAQKLFPLLWAFFAILSASATFASSPLPMACRTVLATFLSGDQEGEAFKSIQDKIQIATDIRRGEAATFSADASLTPLFSFGVVHRFIAQELSERGHRSLKEVESALVLMSTVSTEDEQIELVSNIVDRIIRAFNIDTAPLKDHDGVENIEAQAKALNLDLRTYAQLVSAVKRQAPADYLIIKLAVLEELTETNPNLAARISAYNTLLDRFSKLWARKFSKKSALEITSVNTTSSAGSYGEEQARSVKERLDFLKKLAGNLEDLKNAETFNHVFIPTVDEIGKRYCEGMKGDQFVAFGKDILALSRKLSSDKKFIEAVESLMKASRKVYLTADQREVFTGFLKHLSQEVVSARDGLWSAIYHLDQKWGKEG